VGHPSGWTIQQTSSQDHAKVSGLIASARWKHLHLDWIQPHQLAGQLPFLLAWHEGLPLCALGCPPDPPQVAWIRVFAVTSGVSLGGSWEALWPPSLAMLREARVLQAAALVSAGWMEPLLERSGFSLENDVVFMEHRLSGIPEPPPHPGELRPLRPADLPEVLSVDWRAFEGLWRFSTHTLKAALDSAGRASAVEAEGKVVGYQITTESPFGAHLARLAVEPAWQGRGIGRALAVEALNWADGRGLDVLSVNTQADNAAGRRLYRSLGFLESGQVFPVYGLPLTAP